MAAREPVEEQRYPEAAEPPVGPAGAQRPTGSGGGGTADLVAGADRSDDEPPKMASADPGATESDTPPLLSPEETERFRVQWESIQVGFVDEPRQSVQEADQLVAGLMRELAESFARQRSSLEAGWDRGEDVSTEELRISLQRYRSFFQRLLAA